MDGIRDFAAAAHGPQSYGAHSYVWHLDCVAAVLREHGHHDVADLAYVHDLVEDTDVTVEEVRARFGDAAAAVARFCADEPGPNRRARKAATMARMRAEIARGIDPHLRTAILVKVADRVANVEASIASGPGPFRMYSKDHPDFRAALYVAGLCDEMWARLDRVFRRKVT